MSSTDLNSRLVREYAMNTTGLSEGHIQALRRVVALEDTRDELVAALKDAIRWLEPGPCGQHNCEGCLCEMQLAHDALVAALAKATAHD